MEAVQSIQALQMALTSLGGAAVPLQLTHHSDRGIQYCSTKYVKLLQDKGIKISMTENGDPLENAIAERVNGIIKEEYLEHYRTTCLKEAKNNLVNAITLYNNERPHMSIENFTPNQLHNNPKQIKKRLWKNYYKKLNNFKQNSPVNVLQDLS